MKRLWGCLILVMCVMMLIGCNGETFNGQIKPTEMSFNREDYKGTSGVKAVFFKDAEGRPYKFIIMGTTDYAENEKDIVASAVSVLSLNTVNALNQIIQADMKVDSTAWEEKPYLECEISQFKTQKEQDQITILLETLEQGLQGISEIYGEQYVKVVEM